MLEPCSAEIREVGTGRGEVVPGNVSIRSRYIGSKSRIGNAIVDAIGTRRPGARLVDLFCGTGAVSKAASEAGWVVHANDYLISSAIIARAQLINRTALKFSHTGGYEHTIAHLNAVHPQKGPIHAEYAPTGRSKSGHIRKYFSEANAAKIDGIRSELATLFAKERISRLEYELLLADLISAANSVANIAGTYGCFLSKWSENAKSSLRLRPRSLPLNLPRATFSSEDAFTFKDRETDIIYCDPPYTKRQYAAYYHLLETIVIGDLPNVTGVAGIRHWQDKSSPFCFRRKALSAFSDLIRSKRAKTFFISYSSEGHIAINDLVTTLKEFGTVTLTELSTLARYTPNRTSRSNGTRVTEYILKLDR